jgi:hypothetical protein
VRHEDQQMSYVSICEHFVTKDDLQVLIENCSGHFVIGENY